MNTFMTTFYIFLLLLSFSPRSESHRKHLLQFSPVPDVSISFIPTASPSEIPSNPHFSPPIPPLIPSKHSPPPSPIPPSNPSHSPPPSPIPPSIPSYSPPPSPIPSNSPLPSPIPPSPSSPAPSPSPSWCIAKPSAPEDKVQEAMDYACGAGGADCMEIRPGGACFYPDTVLAHASFAFNSYWQREKNHGGSCDFGGAAIVVISDPSFEGCHFKLD